MQNFNIKTFSLSQRDFCCCSSTCYWGVWAAWLIQVQKHFSPCCTWRKAHTFSTPVSLVPYGMECKLLTRLDFWVHVFVGLPSHRPVCSKLPAQTKAVRSFVACFLPLMKSVYSLELCLSRSFPLPGKSLTGILIWCFMFSWILLLQKIKWHSLLLSIPL